MSSPSARAARISSFILTDPRTIGALTAVYIVLGFVFVRTDYTLHDEGLLTHYWANWARQDFVPVFFFQKVKPVLTALYLPFTAMGVHATLYAHVLVSGLSIPMLASTARNLGYRLPNLPAIVLMFSPIYFFGGASGLSNIDGVVGVTLVLYLLVSRRSPLGAGLIAGMLPWVRFELAIFSFLIALYGLTSPRDRSAFLGTAVFPVLYSICGAFYHHDLLWLLHYPPSAPFDPTNPVHRHQLVGVRYFLEPALAVTPVAAVVAAIPLDRMGRFERLILIYTVLAIAAVHVLPIFHVGNFGASPRYSIHVLPALALLLGRAVEPWWEGARLDMTRLFAVLLLGVWMATRQADTRIVIPILIAYAVIVVAARIGYGKLAAMLTVGVAAVGPLLPVRFEVGRALTAGYLDPIVEWLDAHPDQAREPIYTNSQLLAPFLEERGRPPGTVFYLAGVDSIREGMLMNEENGQRSRLLRFAKNDLYGKAILHAIAPGDLPPGSLLALRVESRLPVLLPDELWAPHLEVLAESLHYKIARVRDGSQESGPGGRVGTEP